MDLDALLAELSRRGVDVSVHDGRLQVRAPRGAIDAELKAHIAAQRDALVAALSVRGGLARSLAGRTLLVTGSTGFLGKTFVARLVQIAPEIDRVLLLIRGGGQYRTAADRLRAEITDLPVLGVLPPGRLADKLEAVQGELTRARFGLGDRAWAELCDRIDGVVHIAGVVELSPPLGSALSVNVDGTANAIALARDAGVPLVHTSTCYVSGRRGGRIPEVLEVGDHPRREQGVEGFDAKREIAACRALVAASRERAEDPAVAAVAGEGVHEAAREVLRRQAAERAANWGYPNIYTYTKGLAEQLVAKAREQGLRAAVVRPSILESAFAFPLAGWTQGINTSAPLVWLAREGHTTVPAKEGTCLDILPVDMAAGAMVAVTAELLEGRADAVYQLASGDTNPVEARRLVELTDFALKRQERSRPASLPSTLKRMVLRPRTASLRGYETYSAPALQRAARFGRETLESVGTLTGPALAVRDALHAQETHLGEIVALFEEYHLVLSGPGATYQTGNMRRLRDQLSPADRRAIGFEPESIDWRRYWMHTQLPGLERWCFPELDRLAAAGRKTVARTHLVQTSGGPQPPAPASLVGMLRDAVARDPHHPMLERITAREVLARIEAGATRLRAMAVRPGDRVGLVSENRSEWVLGWFAIRRAGATAVPLDPGLDTPVIAALLERAGAATVLVSHRQRREHPALDATPLEALVTDGPVDLDPAAHDTDAAATLIYTSGTTGDRKGVLLSEAGLCAQVASLSRLFDVGPGDRSLSVLPLYHVLEFTCGVLFPLYAGATVCFARGTTPELLRADLARVRPTGLVAVPALLDAVLRGIRGRAAEGRAGRWFDVALGQTGAVRRALGVNVGRHLFSAAHDALGGALRYVVSGGAPLSASTLEGFQGLGLDVYEGYGLTETSPVVAAWRIGDTPRAGSVGRALPGVDIRLVGVSPDGTGEIAVRGPSVMLGYDGDPEATQRVLDADGWFRTGDLGRLDSDGCLSIVGRVKEQIVDAAGHTVHPDEIEEAFTGLAGVAELSVSRVVLPGGREIPGALVVVDEGASESGVRASFEAINRTLPVEKRVGLLRLTDAPLPRGPTRKVQRREVEAMLSRPVDPNGLDEHSEAHLVEELGLDSLALLELRARREAEQTAPVPAPRATPDDGPTHLPEPLRTAGRAAFGALSRRARQELLQVRVDGRENIPWGEHVIVVANHCSHLDVPTIQQALAGYADDALSVAAKDYFFATPARRFFFDNFTNVMAFDREDPSRGELDRLAGQLVEGRTLILFPEGTRSATGALGPFFPGVGYLAMHARAGVLPLYLQGTHAALPKGASVLRSRELGARIGPLLAHHTLAAACAGLPRHEQYAAVAAQAREAVIALRDGPTRRVGAHHG